MYRRSRGGLGVCEKWLFFFYYIPLLLPKGPALGELLDKLHVLSHVQDWKSRSCSSANFLQKHLLFSYRRGVLGAAFKLSFSILNARINFSNASPMQHPSVQVSFGGGWVGG